MIINLLFIISVYEFIINLLLFIVSLQNCGNV